VAVTRIGEDSGREVSRLEMCEIIEARMRETFEMIRGELEVAGHGLSPAGLVLTGGASQLSGITELGRDVLQMPVRVAAPTNVGGLVDHLLTPAFSTSIGLLQWGARSLAVTDSGRYESAPSGGLFGRVRDGLRSIFP
jgi:cell division protein FtsA